MKNKEALVQPRGNRMPFFLQSAGLLGSDTLASLRASQIVGKLLQVQLDMARLAREYERAQVLARSAGDERQLQADKQALMHAIGRLEALLEALSELFESTAEVTQLLKTASERAEDAMQLTLAL